VNAPRSRNLGRQLWEDNSSVQSSTPHDPVGPRLHPLITLDHSSSRTISPLRLVSALHGHACVSSSLAALNFSHARLWRIWVCCAATRLDNTVQSVTDLERSFPHAEVSEEHRINVRLWCSGWRSTGVCGPAPGHTGYPRMRRIA
jgi:hypothetical protein